MMDRVDIFREELREELQGNILPFWMDRVADPGGGFIGRVSGEGAPDPDAPRGAVMYARILWTFSAAYRIFRNREYLQTATRARDWLLEHFYDRRHGGVYWSIDRYGRPLETKKQIYALGFAIYGLSEYNRATGDPLALEYAVKLYRDIEAHAFDPVHGGYVEATARDWSELGDVRLSAKDSNERKTMNTHLHVIEPYTNLYRVLKDEGLRRQIAGLLDVFMERIYSPRTHHSGLFFDDTWAPQSPGEFSFGHDIEASWLLLEAARELGEGSLTEKVERHCRDIAHAAMDGYMPDGSMIYERHANGSVDMERHWWAQAETVVGLWYLYRHHGQSDALDKCLATWEYIRSHLIDRRGGEWFWSIRADGSPNTDDDKAGFWKCPYHNGRMCMEILESV
jgi:mannobiose 2-epimerase